MQMEIVTGILKVKQKAMLMEILMGILMERDSHLCNQRADMHNQLLDHWLYWVYQNNMSPH